MENTNSSEFILASLSSFKSEFDDTMKYMRTQIEQNPNPSVSWIFKPFLYALISFKIQKEDDLTKIINDILGSTYLTLLFTLVFGLKELNPSNALDANNYLLIFLIALSYLISVISNFHRLIRIGDKHFDISAYAFIKKEEYNLFLAYKEAKPFTFSNLYDHIRDLTNATVKEIQGFREHLITKDQYLWEKEETIKALSEKLKIEETEGGNLVKKLGELLEEYKQQSYLLNHTMDTIQSMNQNRLCKDDLRVITDYSLFEEINGKLYRVAYHKTANTPLVIDPNSREYRNWAVSRAFRSDSDVIELDESHGRVIASKKFKTPKGTFVYSFHFYESDDSIYGILDKEELYRLLYILVLFFKDTDAYLKEVQKHEIG